MFECLIQVNFSSFMVAQDNYYLIHLCQSMPEGDLAYGE